MDVEREIERQLKQLHLEVKADRIKELLQLLEELLRWNRRINLTAVTTLGEGVEKHLVDSLTLLPHLVGNERLLDLGSGGGFPGLPLKISRSGLKVTSVDAVAKKISFQRHIVRLLGVEDFETLHERAEHLPKRPGFTDGFDVVVSRAFTSLPRFAELALPCLAKNGRMIAMKGASGEGELQEAETDLDRLGLTCSGLHRLQLPVSKSRRTLLVVERKSTI